MELGILTFNISADFLKPPGVPSWEERRALVVQELLARSPDIIACQEVMPKQFTFLNNELEGYTPLTIHPINPDPEMLTVFQAKYGAFGFTFPPDPYEVVTFYRSSQFELKASGSWWLSPTPEKPSIGFGNVAPRAVLWARLLHKAANLELIVFNTHIDHRCLAEMITLCREQLSAFMTLGLPLIFAGDFNFGPETEHYQMFIGDGWKDSFIVTTPSNSFTPSSKPIRHIDHIFYRGEGWQSISWAPIISPITTMRLSDHDPVYVQLSQEKSIRLNP